MLSAGWAVAVAPVRSRQRGTIFDNNFIGPGFCLGGISYKHIKFTQFDHNERE
jgi:hypothetical protein